MALAVVRRPVPSGRLRPRAFARRLRCPAFQAPPGAGKGGPRSASPWARVRGRRARRPCALLEARVRILRAHRTQPSAPSRRSRRACRERSASSRPRRKRRRGSPCRAHTGPGEAGRSLSSGRATEPAPLGRRPCHGRQRGFVTAPAPVPERVSEWVPAVTGKAKPEATAKGTRLEVPPGRQEPEPEAVHSPCLEPEAGRGRPPELHEMQCSSRTRERTLVGSSLQARRHRSPPSGCWAAEPVAHLSRALPTARVRAASASVPERVQVAKELRAHCTQPNALSLRSRRASRAHSASSRPRRKRRRGSPCRVHTGPGEAGRSLSSGRAAEPAPLGHRPCHGRQRGVVTAPAPVPERVLKWVPGRVLAKAPRRRGEGPRPAPSRTRVRA